MYTHRFLEGLGLVLQDALGVVGADGEGLNRYLLVVEKHAQVCAQNLNIKI
jgi:hypothetical protein